MCTISFLINQKDEKMNRTVVNILGWMPLIIYWTIYLTAVETPDWSIALPAFSIGVFVTAIFNDIFN